ncbi:MAG: hypothetical protein QOI47_572 [Actinomycetota bacterium]|nr:hypothetical protein [Actinomycetota bacterium]
MDAGERREFVRENNFCVWGYNRKEHGPAMTIGYYWMDGDDICYFTMAARAKTKAALRDPRASVCVIDMKRPPSYLLVYGTVTVESDPEYVYRSALKTFEIEMAGEGNPVDGDKAALQRDAVRTWCEEEERVVLRLTPESTFYSPPTRGKNAVEKSEFRRTLGAVEPGSMRIGQALPW